MVKFYQIMTADGKRNYLYGTIHSGDTEVNRLPKEVAQAFQEACIVVLEVSDFDANKNNIEENVYTEWKLKHGTTHQLWSGNYKHVEKIVNKIAPFFSWSTSRDQIRSYVIDLPPSILLMKALKGIYLQAAEVCRFTPALDYNLYLKAKRFNKSIIGLETTKSQLEIISQTRLSYDEQRRQFDLKLEKLTTWHRFFISFAAQLEISEVKNKYLRNDVDENTLEPQHDIFLIHDRDQMMASKLKSYFENGGVFAAVGCAHLKGIIKHLKDNTDYTIEAISTGKHVYPLTNFYWRNIPSFISVAALLVVCSMLLNSKHTLEKHIPTSDLNAIILLTLTAALFKSYLLSKEFINEPSWPRRKTLSTHSTFGKNIISSEESKTSSALHLTYRA